jgi:hypothetical protein
METAMKRKIKTCRSQLNLPSFGQGFGELEGGYRPLVCERNPAHCQDAGSSNADVVGVVVLAPEHSFRHPHPSKGRRRCHGYRHGRLAQSCGAAVFEEANSGELDFPDLG